MTESPITSNELSSDDDAVSVVRREERLLVRTETIAREIVKIEKVIVTEQRTITVEVRREEFQMTRTPADERSAASLAASDGAHSPLTLTLHEEQVIVSKTVVPVERVRVDVRTVTGQESIVMALHKEQVDVEVDPGARHI